MDVLAGVRVVEMGLWVAGPAAGGILADWGADVVKIEPPSGDPMHGLFGALSGSKERRCPPFDLYNRGKRSVAIDVNTPEGRDPVERVVADADVFLTNIRPAFLERVGLGHDRLLELYPRLVYASLTGYGLTGPDRDAPGFDVAAFGARAGLSDRSTPAGQAPTTLPGGLGDAVTGLSLVAGLFVDVPTTREDATVTTAPSPARPTSGRPRTRGSPRHRRSGPIPRPSFAISGWTATS